MDVRRKFLIQSAARPQHSCPELRCPIPGGAPGHGWALVNLSWGQPAHGRAGPEGFLPIQLCCGSVIDSMKSTATGTAKVATIVSVKYPNVWKETTHDRCFLPRMQDKAQPGHRAEAHPRLREHQAAGWSSVPHSTPRTKKLRPGRIPAAGALLTPSTPGSVLPHLPLAVLPHYS